MIPEVSYSLPPLRTKELAERQAAEAAEEAAAAAADAASQKAAAEAEAAKVGYC